jgi:hypothetical protein
MSETLADRLEAFFREHPRRWFDGRRLGDIAGGYGWRTRCSDLRKRGMDIRNRQTPMTNSDGLRWKLSEYAYYPAGEASVPTAQPHNLNAASAGSLF